MRFTENAAECSVTDVTCVRQAALRKAAAASDERMRVRALPLSMLPGSPAASFICMPDAWRILRAASVGRALEEPDQAACAALLQCKHEAGSH